MRGTDITSTCATLVSGVNKDAASLGHCTQSYYVTRPYRQASLRSQLATRSQERISFYPVLCGTQLAIDHARWKCRWYWAGQGADECLINGLLVVALALRLRTKGLFKVSGDFDGCCIVERVFFQAKK